MDPGAKRLILRGPNGPQLIWPLGPMPHGNQKTWGAVETPTCKKEPGNARFEWPTEHKDDTVELQQAVAELRRMTAFVKAHYAVRLLEVRIQYMGELHELTLCASAQRKMSFETFHHEACVA